MFYLFGVFALGGFDFGFGVDDDDDEEVIIFVLCFFETCI